MIQENLVEIKVIRENDELIYSLDCSSNLTEEELEYYLEEIIKGICEWKPNICSGHSHPCSGSLKRKKD